MIQISPRGGGGQAGEIRNDDGICPALHPPHPEGIVAVNAGPVPVIGKPEIKDGLRIMLCGHAISYHARAQTGKKMTRTQAPGPVQQGDDD
jgi:hypothetical protein